VLADQIEIRDGHRTERGAHPPGAPNADLPVILGTYHFHIVKAGTTDFAAGIGTGPFKVGVQAGRALDRRAQRELLEAGPPYLDEVELVGIPTRALASTRCWPATST
jgi:peptide/nickel transport system substrate-binding protein